MTLTSLQAAILAAELSTIAAALCVVVVALIVQDGPARSGRHAAPPTPPQSPPAVEPDPGPRHLAPDWRAQVEAPELPGPEPVLVRPYVAHLGTAVAR